MPPPSAQLWLRTDVQSLVGFIPQPSAGSKPPMTQLQFSSREIICKFLLPTFVPLLKWDVLWLTVPGPAGLIYPAAGDKMRGSERQSLAKSQRNPGARKPDHDGPRAFGADFRLLPPDRARGIDVRPPRRQRRQARQSPPQRRAH